MNRPSITYGINTLIQNLDSAELFHLLIENANDAILFMNPTQFVECNSRALEVFGAKSKDDIITSPPWMLSPEKQPDGSCSKTSALEYISAAVANSFNRFYWQHKRLDGTLFDAEVSLHSFVVDNEVFVQSIVRDITRFKKTEEALRKSEQRYKSIFENVQDVFYQTDAESRIALISPSISRYSSYSVEELIGRPVGSLYAHPGQRDKLLAVLMNEGQVSNFEVELISGPETTIIVSVSANVLLNEKGEFNGIEGVLHDITAIKNAYNDVVKERIMLRTLIDNLPDTVYVKDLEGRKIIANSADLKFIGVDSESEVLYKTDKELFAGAEGEHGWSQDMEVINKGISLVNVVSSSIDRNGDKIWLRTSKIPLKDVDGNIVGLVGIGHDITSDVAGNKALKESEEKYRTLMESIPDGVYRSTPDGRFIEANKALVAILGYDNKEELFKVDIKKELYFDIKDRETAVLTEKFEEMAIYPLRKKNGQKIWVEDHGWLKTDELGNVVYHEGVLRDITERYNFQVQLGQYTEQLKQANETKDKLFSIIAHDLLSPFNAMLGFTNLLCDDEVVFSEEEKRDMLLRLKGVAGNTFKLLQNLLTWSRMQRGKINLESTVFNLKEMLLTVFEVLEEAAHSKKIRLVDQLANSLQVYADKSVTHIVLYNLVVNGLKFTQEGGVVSVSGDDLGDFVEIRVKDTGIGIPADRLANLFVAGGSKSTPGTNNEKGTGLGLVLCKEFVEMHKGSIRVVSEPGKGSEFILLLPSGSFVQKKGWDNC